MCAREAVCALCDASNGERRINQAGEGVLLLGRLAEFLAVEDVTTTHAVIAIISAEIWLVWWLIFAPALLGDSWKRISPEFFRVTQSEASLLLRDVLEESHFFPSLDLGFVEG